MPVCNVMRTPCYCRILRVGKSCAACSEAELGYLIAAPSRAGDGHGIQCGASGWEVAAHLSSQRMRTRNTSTPVITLLFSWCFWGSPKKCLLLVRCAQAISRAQPRKSTAKCRQLWYGIHQQTVVYGHYRDFWGGPTGTEDS